MGHSVAVSFAETLRSGDRAAITRLLSDDVVFHSPVADYRGRDAVSTLLVTIGTVVDDIRVRREVVQGPEIVTFVEGDIGGRAVDGVIDQVHDADGRISEITLMLRPLDALLEGVKRMGAALAG